MAVLQRRERARWDEKGDRRPEGSEAPSHDAATAINFDTVHHRSAKAVKRLSWWKQTEICGKDG